MAGKEKLVILLLADGTEAQIDEQDAARVLRHRWFRTRRGKQTYAVANINQHTEYLHRFVLEGVARIDHVNGNGLDNQRANLRPATRSQNYANMQKPKARTATPSRFKGVYWNARDKRWQAQIKRPQTSNRYLGQFLNEEDAARAYDAALIALHGEYARPNFPAEYSKE